MANIRPVPDRVILNFPSTSFIYVQHSLLGGILGQFFISHRSIPHRISENEIQTSISEGTYPKLTVARDHSQIQLHQLYSIMYSQQWWDTVSSVCHMLCPVVHQLFGGKGGCFICSFNAFLCVDDSMYYLTVADWCYIHFMVGDLVTSLPLEVQHTKLSGYQLGFSGSQNQNLI